MKYEIGEEFFQRFNWDRPSILFKGRYSYDTLVEVESIDDHWINCVVRGGGFSKVKFSHNGISDDGESRLIEKTAS